MASLEQAVRQAPQPVQRLASTGLAGVQAISKAPSQPSTLSARARCSGISRGLAAASGASSSANT